MRAPSHARYKIMAEYINEMVVIVTAHHGHGAVLIPTDRSNAHCMLASLLLPLLLAAVVAMLEANGQRTPGAGVTPAD